MREIVVGAFISFLLLFGSASALLVVFAFFKTSIQTLSFH